MADDKRRQSCVLCALGRTRGGYLPSDTGINVVYIDDELIALLQDGLPGVLLAPRQHIGALSTFPERSAAFLAALRRTVIEVRLAYQTSGAMIEPTTDVPGATGHVCYHVVPTMRDGGPLPSVEGVVQAQRVFEALRDRVSPRQLEPALRTGRPASMFGPFPS